MRLKELTRRGLIRGSLLTLKRRPLRLALVGLVAGHPSTLLSQNAEQSAAFPGGVILQWKTDEMTDEKRCAIFTPRPGLYVGIYGRDAVSLWTPERKLPSPQRPALLRIDSAPPLRLVVGEKPGLLSVPKANASQVVEALYRHSKMVVRYYTFPELDEETVTIAVGDVGSAYDDAVQRCGWPSLGLTRVPLPKEPRIYRAEKGYLSATFPAEGGWSVIFMPEFQTCRISGAVIHSIFGSTGGTPDQVLPLGQLSFLDKSGQVVVTLRHDRFAPAPIAQILTAAERAGEYGFVTFERGGETERVPLYGLTEAAAFAEQTCGVRLR